MSLNAITADSIALTDSNTRGLCEEEYSVRMVGIAFHRRYSVVLFGYMHATCMRIISNCIKVHFNLNVIEKMNTLSRNEQVHATSLFVSAYWRLPLGL